MSDMTPDQETLAMQEDLRSGYGDSRPVVEIPVAAPQTNARLRDWRRRTSVDALQQR